MEAELAAAHPEIKTYAGNSVTDGYVATIRLDVTPLGFHASVIGGDKKAWYIDPAYLGDTSLYLSYWGDALPAREKPFVEPELAREDAAGDHARRHAAHRRGPTASSSAGSTDWRW